MVAQQAEMEDILSSIRTTLAEETAKVGSGSADLIDAAAQDDEVLELTSAEMLDVSGSAPSANGEELIDIAAFAQTGETKVAEPAVSGGAVDPLGEELPVVVVADPAPEPAAAPAAAGGAADEFDRLLAEISQEQKQQISAAEEQKQALLAEEEPLGADAVAPVNMAVEMPEQQPVVPVSAETVTAAALPAFQQQYQLGTVESVDGVQIALPAEVLAMALRPMVQQWLNDNLSAVVERLVKDEISKLTQN